MGNSRQEGIGVKLTKFCTKCQTEKNLEAFCKRKTSKDGYDHYCKDCVSVYRKTHYKKIRESSAEYYIKNKERINKRDRVNHLKRKYGVTQEWYDEQLTLQDGGCKICGTKDPGKGLKHFHVDHSHKTGKVRGLLCHSCNTGLGFFKEDVKLIEKAIEYVNRHSKH